MTSPLFSSLKNVGIWTKLSTLYKTHICRQPLLLGNQYRYRTGGGYAAQRLKFMWEIIITSPVFRIFGVSLRTDPRIRDTDIRIRILLCSSVTFKMPERSGFLKNFVLFFYGTVDILTSVFEKVTIPYCRNQFFFNKVSTDRGYRYLHTFYGSGSLWRGSDPSFFLMRIWILLFT